MMRTESETTHVPLMAHPAMASYLTNSISTNNNNNDNTNNTIDHTTILNTNHSKETTDSNENNSGMLAVIREIFFVSNFFKLIIISTFLHYF